MKTKSKGNAMRENGYKNGSITNEFAKGNSATPESTASGDSLNLDTESGEVPGRRFEDLLVVCGEAGRWQLKVFLLASFCGFCTALHNLVYAFIGAKPEFVCRLPDVPGYSHEQLKNSIIPRDDDGKWEQCKRYPLINQTIPDSSLEDLVDKNTTINCDIGYDYDDSIFKSTILTDYNLVCGDEYLATIVQVMYMVGILCGSPIFGAVSDKLGRKKAILIATIIFILTGPLVAIFKNYSLIVLSRFILAASSPGIYGTSFVLVIELIGPGWRGLVGNLFCLPFALGYMLLPGVAYFVRDWRTLQLILCAPSVILIFTWYFLPESPRWLLRKGREAEAEAILRQMAKANGRNKLPDNFSEMVTEIADLEREEVFEDSWISRFNGILSGYANLLRSPKIRTRTLVLYFSWMSVSMVYYGIALNAPNLSTDPYLYMFIGGVLEIPSYFMVPPLIGFFGRRPVFSGFLLICSISLLSSLLVAEGSVVIVVLAQLGKLLIGGAYALIYLYATELLPTLLRTYGLGTASMVGRIGSATAPLIVDLVGKENNIYPTIIFGCISLIAGFLSLLLPETRNKKLPETVEDVETDS